jgi:L-lysine 6-transaminase
MKVDPKNTIETTSNFMLSDLLPVVIDLEKSRGNILVDARDGRSWIDCISFVASNPLGHNHQKMFEPEFEKKLLQVARSKPSNSDFFTTERASFLDTFSKIAKPSHLKHFFLIEGGTLAVENALKAAFDWKVRKNFAQGHKSELGTKIIHFQHAFHGRSGYALSLTNSKDPRKTKYFPKFDWPRITAPKIIFPLTDENLENVVNLENQAISEIKSAFQKNLGDIAAIIIEPIQGEGGDNHFRAEFHQTLRKLADENEALLIYDEVQSGVGMSGKMWAYQHYGIEPDLITFGKKMQVCGFLSSSRIEEVDNHVFKESSRLNSTWGGSLVDMVRAEQYLKVIESEKLVENAEKVGKYLLSALSQLQDEFPNLFLNARGTGLLCSIDVVSVEKRDAVHKKCFDNGLLLLKGGSSGLRFRPALIISTKEIDEIISIIRKSV